MSKKKSKKHNKKKDIKKQSHSKFLHDGIIIDVPYDEVIRKDISIIKEAIDRLPQNNSNKPTIFIEFFDIPSDAVECICKSHFSQVEPFVLEISMLSPLSAFSLSR